MIDGLIKTGKYSFRVFGGAIKHENYNPISVNPDFLIMPVDGFGSRELIRQALLTERPDALFIFTDPRQFVWLFEIEDEIKQICPIVYWHVWDNDPYPSFNKPFYDSTELINCISWKTYELIKPHYEHVPGKVNYIPHAFPKTVYYPLPKQQIKELRQNNFKERADWFMALWVNRNATRKMPGDVLECWKMFLDELWKQEGHRNALLVMHTDPTDSEGPNLFAVSEMLGLGGHVYFSPQKVEFSEMNVLHNMVDCSVNIAKNEGFGLVCVATLQVGKPVVALKTGGMTEQVVDSRDGVTEYGVAIEPATRVLVGSQCVPFIYEDLADKKAVSEAFMKIYKMPMEERELLGQRAMEYVDYKFNYERMVKDWDVTMEKTITDWTKAKPAQWELVKLGGV